MPPESNRDLIHQCPQRLAIGYLHMLERVVVGHLATFVDTAKKMVSHAWVIYIHQKSRPQVVPKEPCMSYAVIMLLQ